MSEILISVGEFARRLGIGRTKAYALLSSGTVRAVKIGRSTRIPTSEIDKVLAALPQAIFRASPNSSAK